MFIKLCRVLCDVLLILVILTALVMVGPRLLGYRSFAVMSGSMEPDYPVGCLVYAKAVAPETVREGDVITFRLSDSVVATHRVVSVDGDAKTFTTKGDANANADGRPIAFGELIGKVMFSLPLLGNLTLWLTPRRLIVLLIPLIVLFVLPSGGFGKRAEENGTDQRE